MEKLSSEYFSTLYTNNKKAATSILNFEYTIDKF